VHDGDADRAERATLRIPQAGRFAIRALLLGSLAVLAAWPGPVSAEIVGLSFPVRGMVCPLCTRGVEESIGSLRGIGRVTADLASGRVTVEATGTQPLNIQEVRDRAGRAGFPVDGETDVVARGRFTIGAEGRITFRATGSNYTWQVLESHELLSLFRWSPGLRGEFLVGFRLHDRPAGTHPSIAITHFEPAAAASGAPTSGTSSSGTSNRP
jgi:copper chaperone CopZ